MSDKPTGSCGPLGDDMDILVQRKTETEMMFEITRMVIEHAHERECEAIKSDREARAQRGRFLDTISAALPSLISNALAKPNRTEALVKVLLANLPSHQIPKLIELAGPEMAPVLMELFEIAGVGMPVPPTPASSH